ncbi:MAG TPA: DUF418 domain-containing protein [Ferruginibacter sp.]|nr:DUF418 domain-containing protein [Ferruginibacter sp.]HMP20356.1 DUF418 domain-containing protein [Ferruginibacter sp.]
MPASIIPTPAGNRIKALDIIRGVALCGILLMNIPGFGLFHAYDDISNDGGTTGWNLKVWWINTMLFEGTMRGLFSMLFGAGILVFTSRTVNGNSTMVTDLFFRRLLWMVLFGIIHCYLLLWNGEILYAYGIVGMFAFSFRHLQPKKQILAAVIFLTLSTVWNTYDYYQHKHMYEKATASTIKKNNGDSLTKEENKAIEKWEGFVEERKPGAEKKAEEISAMHKSYWSIVLHKAGENQFMQTVFLYRYNFFDILAMMLMGMAFFKLRIFRAERSKRFYLLMALLGYGIGLPVNYLETHTIQSGTFSILAIDKSYITYDLGRVANTCGHIALIMLFIQSGWPRFLQNALAAVGQMAFTNYIMQTLICNFIFLGYGLSLYGKLQRYELYYIVAGIWILQLIISPLWLKYFQYGPLEWLWRSLTYWAKQPFKKQVQPKEAA